MPLTDRIWEILLKNAVVNRRELWYQWKQCSWSSHEPSGDVPLERQNVDTIRRMHWNRDANDSELCKQNSVI